MFVCPVYRLILSGDATAIRMKPVLLLTVATAVVGEMRTHPGAKEICGRLGPMWFDPDELPEGVTPIVVRMCAEHPMSAANWWGFGEYLPHWFPRPPFVKFTSMKPDGRPTMEEEEDLWTGRRER